MPFSLGDLDCNFHPDRAQEKSQLNCEPIQPPSQPEDERRVRLQVGAGHVIAAFLFSKTLSVPGSSESALASLNISWTGSGDDDDEPAL